MGTDAERLAAIITAETEQSLLELARANDNQLAPPARQRALNRNERMTIIALIVYLAEERSLPAIVMQDALLARFGAGSLQALDATDYDAIVAWLVYGGKND